jgi:single-strand DNA-binding protein
MNQITIIGNIGKDPELAFNSAGYPVCKFPVGTSYKKRTGEQETTWHNVVVFGEMGEHCAESLVKGTRVIVIGRPEKGSYEKRDGTKGYIDQVLADDVAINLRFSVVDGVRSASSSKAVSNESLAPEEPF